MGFRALLLISTAQIIMTYVAVCTIPYDRGDDIPLQLNFQTLSVGTVFLIPYVDVCSNHLHHT